MIVVLLPLIVTVVSAPVFVSVSARVVSEPFGVVVKVWLLVTVFGIS